LSLNIGRIIGIPVRIHYTLWFVLLLIAWSLAEGYMPQHYPTLSRTTDWAIGIASAIILFVSVFLHELSHSYIAKKNGLPIKRITLFFFGGVSEMGEEPKDPALEVRMAAAGPLTSFLIAGVLGAFWKLTDVVNGPSPGPLTPIIATLWYATLLNGVLGAFNLIPAFPLDGGRVLRGSLWNRSKNLLNATANATRVSEAISLLMMAVGLFFVVFGDFVNGLWIIFLGWFIRSGAETSLRQTRLTESLGDVKVGDIMTRDLLSVSPEVSVQQLVSDYFLVHPHGGYPVVSNGKLVGVVTMSSVRSIPREKRDYERVSEAMVPFERTVTVSPTTSAVEALRLMAKNGIGRLVVMDGDKIAGIVTRGDLMKMMHARQELGR
jgi:Zn-dependent protease/predicted transcriptional regulator